MSEAKYEAYTYFDRYIRRLPKRKDGRLNDLAPGFDDNDVDAFRHAYTSGVFTQEYSERVANLFGLGWEYRGYSVKLIRGVETPVSKRDGRRINNIG